MNGFARAICWTLTLLFPFGLDSSEPAEKTRKFRISAVQENQVWIEGGLIDGLDQGILEIVPGDVFAASRIKDCEAQLEKQDARMRERRNIPYYREVIRASMETLDADSWNMANNIKCSAADPQGPPRNLPVLSSAPDCR